VTLREAIQAANTNMAVDGSVAGSGADVIVFDAALTSGGAVTINLGGTQLAITSALTITGPGRDLLTIDANRQSRIFHIDDGLAGKADVEISGLTLTGGMVTDGSPDIFTAGDFGGAVFFSENLTVQDARITDNIADRDGGDGGDGGGIYAEGTTTVINSEIDRNSSHFGGGILARGVLTVEDSIVTQNTAVDSGGGLLAADVTLITRSTVSNNSASILGGGIRNDDRLTVTASTISGNQALFGGGVTSLADATFISSTVSGNTATAEGGGLRADRNLTLFATTVTANHAANGGGGVSRLGNDGTAFSATNTLLVLNTVETPPSGNNPNFESPDFEFRNSLLVDNVPNLNIGPLLNNGGPTATHALLPGSAAINGGLNLAPTITKDQRGVDLPENDDNATERAQIAVPTGTTDGRFTLTFPAIPSGSTGTTYARFRLSTDADFKADPSSIAPTSGTVNSALSQKIAEGSGGLPADTLSNSDRFGTSVASLGDLDGDGVADLAVGATGDDTGDDTGGVGQFAERGAVHVLFLEEVDVTSPTVSVSLDDSALKIGETATVTFSFNEAPVGFAADDVTVQNGSLSGLTNSGDPLIFIATFTPAPDIEDTTNVVSVGTSFTDTAGNAGTAGVSANNEIDTLAPTVTVNVLDAALNDADNQSVVTFEFSEVVNGFSLADVSASGGTLNNFSTIDGDSFVAIFTATDGVEVAGSVSVGTGYTDAVGNAGTSGSDNVAIDTLNPTVAITPDGTTTTDSPIVFTFQFSEAVSGFVAGDISITNGSAGTFTPVDADTFTLEVTPDSPGTVTASVTASVAASVASGAAQDAAGNDNVSGSASVTSTAPGEVALPGGGTFEVLIDGADLVLRIAGGAEQFRRSIATVTVLEIAGSAGDDVVSILSSGGAVATPVLFSGGQGADRFDASQATGPATLLGGSGNDTLFGGPGQDDLAGDLGNDTLNGVFRDDAFDQLVGQGRLIGGNRLSARPAPVVIQTKPTIELPDFASAPEQGVVRVPIDEQELVIDIDAAFADVLLPELLSL